MYYNKVEICGMDTSKLKTLSEKEIAALIIAIQERQKEFVPEDSNGVHNQNDESVAKI